MAQLNLAAAATAAALLSAPAWGAPGPASSTQASNIAPSDTRSTVAPRLPAPPVTDAAPRQLLADARTALANGQTGAAQEALERAETRLLNRGSHPSDQHTQLLQAATESRQALGRRNPRRATAILNAALASHALAAAPASSPPQAELAYPPPAHGWSYNAVQWMWGGNAAPSPSPAMWVPPHWAWHDRWVWVGGHWR